MPRGDAFRRLFAALKATASQHLTGALLISGAAVFLGAFGYRATLALKNGYGRQPLAVFVEGRADRKAAGQLGFVPVSAGAELFDLDVLWVPPAQKAVLLLDGKERVTLSEKTLARLKRPFKGFGRARDKILALSGRIILEDELRTQLVNEDAFKPVRAPNKPVLVGMGDIEAFTPSGGALLFSKKGVRASVLLAWPDEVSGVVVISDGDHGNTVFHPVRSQRSARVVLATERRYHWQLTGDDGKIIAGPFQFDLRDYSDARIQEALAKSLQGRKIQVLME